MIDEVVLLILAVKAGMFPVPEPALKPIAAALVAVHEIVLAPDELSVSTISEIASLEHISRVL